MPLPPALLARLQKRGIVKEKPAAIDKQGEEEEEVFAESYDDPAELTKAAVATTDVPLPPVPAATPTTDDVDDEPMEAVLIHEVIACPNKSNPYHECVDFCRLRWGMKAFEPDNTMLRRRTRMLDKYPLPTGWQEIADPQTSRYYYWNTLTDEVSWLSPIHPRTKITLSTEKLLEASKRAELKLDEEGQEQAESSDESGEEQHSSEDEPSDDDRRRQKSRALRDRGRDRRGRVKDDELDPMDPSAYSDVSRGSWSSGLDTRGSAKTGVDHTVSGPLFQQRPYPSPGDILRANRQASEKK